MTLRNDMCDPIEAHECIAMATQRLLPMQPGATSIESRQPLPHPKELYRARGTGVPVGSPGQGTRKDFTLTFLAAVQLESFSIGWALLHDRPLMRVLNELACLFLAVGSRLFHARLPNHLEWVSSLTQPSRACLHSRSACNHLLYGVVCSLNL